MKKWLIGLSVVAILPACVTINIYFPAAAAEKAADKIIDEVWQLKQGQEGAKPTDTPAETPAETPAK
jgi:pyruvate/2-oxoacid:ferredoxin oxidoreductase beta subunit